ncbi:MAG: hypothetical protein WA989_00720 [Henriciella sp.]|uniref:hypothetical protein n=1 Tax=Henriciella sp. TaxID=1968823 RepID=UPI003C78CFE9
MMIVRNLSLRLVAIVAAGLAAPLTAAGAQDARFDQPDPALDAEVEACLEADGVSVLPGTDTICYNAAIFPGQFLQLADMAPADRIIVTSPGGNVATARMMSRILDDRGEPIIIAGQCMSACAMVILPGADDISIHRSAHIAVHGIVMMGYRDWFGWLKNGEAPTARDNLAASMGYNFAYTLHKSGQDHMEKHLDGQDVDQDYIQIISDRMFEDALTSDCRVDPNSYWGMIDAEHLREFLGDRITHMEAFAQDWDDPANKVYKDVTIPIAPQTYIFEHDFEDATCP